MKSKKYGGCSVAVKTMPNKWVRSGPDRFKEYYPNTGEQPWNDLGLLKSLNRMDFPYVCDLLGVFRDSQNMYVVTSLATEGDLFSWCFLGPKPGREREALMQPIVSQLFSAVKWLHEIGIAHRDISLENILLTDAGCGSLRVKIIDFGMATLSQKCHKEVRGKPSYQAPEMHLLVEYDAFLADAFSIGVVLFSMMAQDYPWLSTKLGSCPLFDCANMFGLKQSLKKQKLHEVFTPAFTELVGGLLEINPQDRLGLGESCYARGVVDRNRLTVWDMRWLEIAGCSRPPQTNARCGRVVRSDPCRQSPKK